MTHRQFRTWQAWLAMEWDRPSRTDWYIMANSCEVRRVLSKKPNSIQPTQFKLPFVNIEPSKVYVRKEGGPPGPLTREEVQRYRNEMAKADAIAKVQKVKPRGLK